MGSHARSPGWAARDKRPAPAAPAGPPDGPPDGPVDGPADGPAPAAAVLVLAAGCALQLALDGVELLLEPAPTAVLHVRLGARSVLLVPEALGGAQPGLQPGALLRGLGQVVAVEQAWGGAGAHLELVLLPGADAAGRGELELRPEPRAPPPAWPGGAGPSPSPERGPYCSLGLGRHPGTPGRSSLRPLPPSPPPGAPERPPERALGPHRRARRCLFPE
ncbi:proline-rich protein 23B-like [Sorex fumeus]|uniref:proline-rich protein 23B-like n=1 Tax=Sorex fumeus TaxID=62283 RepID=UPI0024ADE341|nr:proline-rich protein 23B-like [Sorex fumeus]